MKKTVVSMFFIVFLLLIGTTSMYSSTPVHAAYTPGGGGGAYVPCSLQTWITKELADDDENGFHLHIQLQALMDQNDTNHYCGRVIGNAFLDEPVGATGELDTTIDDGSTSLVGGIFDHVYQSASCNLPTQCTFISTDSGRGVSKFELGGQGYSIALSSTNGIYSNYVQVHASFTQQTPNASQSGTTATIPVHAATATWKMSNLPSRITMN